MTIYSLFSRPTSWSGNMTDELIGVPIRCYRVGEFRLESNIAKKMVGKTGQDIFMMYCDLISSEMKNLCEIYHNWYLYPIETRIGELSVD